MTVTAFAATAAGIVVRLPAEVCERCDPKIPGRAARNMNRATSCVRHRSTKEMSDPGWVLGPSIWLRQPVDAPDDELHRLIRYIKGRSDHSGEVVLRALHGVASPALYGLGEGSTELDVATALAWIVHGSPAEEMHQFVAAGVRHPGEAAGWRETMRGTAGAVAWIPTGLDKHTAREWVYAGFTPQTIPEGFADPKHWVFTDEAKVPPTPQWGALYEDMAPSFAGEGHRQGRGPAAVSRLANALLSSASSRSATDGGTARRGRLTVRWSVSEQVEEQMVSLARAIDGSDWEDFATCIEAGMSEDEAAAYLRSGGDMEPIRLMAALAEEPDLPT